MEAETARLREAERQLEEIRVGHYRASDEVHAVKGVLRRTPQPPVSSRRLPTFERTGSASNGSSLNWQRSSRRDREQRAVGDANLAHWRGELALALEQSAAREGVAQGESEKLPVAEEAFRAIATATMNCSVHSHRRTRLCRSNTKRAHAQQVLDQLAQRAERLREESGTLQAPAATRLARLSEDITALEGSLRTMRGELEAQEGELPHADQALRERTVALETATHLLAGLEARAHTLTQLQERLEGGAGTEEWLKQRGLAGARGCGREYALNRAGKMRWKPFCANG